MCGIFAYFGNRPAPEILLGGLKKLEYRGYDSSGIAFFQEEKVKKIRACGTVSELEKKIKTLSFPKSNSHKSLGIGHTRWATHGSVSLPNAHPHQSSSIYIVHNGTIENEQELRSKINSKLLKSETDSELVAHLIFQAYQKNKDFLKSVIEVTSYIKGSYAIVALCSDKKNEMIAFKKEAPLILCKEKKEYFISSDVYAASEYAKQVIFLDDEEILHLKNDDFQIYNFKGEKIKKEFEKFSTTQEENVKQHPHFMLKEIIEQPSAISQVLKTHVADDKTHVADVRKSQDDVRKTMSLKVAIGKEAEFNNALEKSSHLLLIGCGSSYYAALFAKYFIESICNIKVDTEIASEFIYRKSFIPTDTNVLFISQSGETADILTAFKQVKQQGLKSISLCNREASSLTRKTDYTLLIEAGMESAVASTKSFSNSLVMLSLLGVHIAKIKKQIESSKEQEIINGLLELPVHMEKLLTQKQFFKDLSETLKKFEGFFYLGRGLYYTIALEGALKLKEIAYLHAEAYPAGEMKHGPLAMIDKNMLAIFLIPTKTDKLYEKTLLNLKEAKTRGANILAIGGCQDEELKKSCLYHLVLPEIHSSIHPFLSLIPLQLIAYFISVSYGYNPDRPKNLAKSVTVE